MPRPAKVILLICSDPALEGDWRFMLQTHRQAFDSSYYHVITPDAPEFITQVPDAVLLVCPLKNEAIALANKFCPKIPVVAKFDSNTFGADPIRTILMFGPHHTRIDVINGLKLALLRKRGPKPKPDSQRRMA